MTAIMGSLAVGLVVLARRGNQGRRIRLLHARGGTTGSTVRARFHLGGALSERLHRRLVAADVEIEPENALVLWATTTAVAAILGGALAGVAGAAAASGCGVVAGPGALWALRRRRALKLAASVPVLLEAVARELRAGGTVASAVEQGWATGIVERELAVIRSRGTLGLTLAENLSGWSESHRGSEAGGAVATAAVALRIAAATGGRAADPLDALAGAMRAETGARADARALAAQGRVSALILGILPAASLLFSLLFDGDAAAALLGSPVGRACLVGGLALEAVGLWWMRRIVGVAG